MDAQEYDSEQRGIPLEHVQTDKNRTTKIIVWGIVALIAGAILVVSLLSGSVVFIVIMLLLTMLAVAGFARQMQSRSQWENPQLFWPSGEPLELGRNVTARYRRSAKKSGLTGGSQLEATLSCEERATYRQGTDTHVARNTIYDVPVTVVVYPHPTMVEADLHIQIPLFAAPPSMDIGNNEIRWMLEVHATTPGADQKSHFPITVAPMVHVQAVD